MPNLSLHNKWFIYLKMHITLAVLVASISPSVALVPTERSVDDMASNQSLHANENVDAQTTVDLQIDELWQQTLCFVSTGELSEGARILRKIVRMEKDRSQEGRSVKLSRALNALADCYLALNCDELAEDAFVDALIATTNNRNKPNSAASWFGLARLAERQGQLDRSLKYYKRAVKNFSTTHTVSEKEVWSRYEFLLRTLGRSQGADRAAQRIKEKL